MKTKSTLQIASLITGLLFTLSAPCFAGQAGEPEYFVQNMHCLGDPFGLNLPATLPELLAMAPVLSKQVQPAEKWDGYTTTRETVRFKGLVLDLVTYSNHPQRYSLASAEIRSKTWSRLSPFKLGQSPTAIHQQLGVGEDDDNLQSRYSGENESVRFETHLGRVTAVIYECYTG